MAPMDAPHVRQLLCEPFLEGMLSRSAERRLLAQRGSLKEISEAYAARDELAGCFGTSAAGTRRECVYPAGVAQ